MQIQRCTLSDCDSTDANVSENLSTSEVIWWSQFSILWSPTYMYIVCLLLLLYCNTLHHTAPHCTTLQHTATYGKTSPVCSLFFILWSPTYRNMARLWTLLTNWNALKRAATTWIFAVFLVLVDTLPPTVTHCNTLQHKKNLYLWAHLVGRQQMISLQHTLQHAATHCNILQHTGHCNTLQHSPMNCGTPCWPYNRSCRSRANNSHGTNLAHILKKSVV